MRSEPSLAKTQDSPEGHANQYTTSTVRPHLNRTKPKENDNALPASSPLEDPEDHRISLPPSQDQESSTGSPAPSIPSTPRLSTAESPLSLHKNSYFESVTGSDRSTPVSVAVHKRGVRKPFVKEGFRYRVHPLKNQVSSLLTWYVILAERNVSMYCCSMTGRRRQNFLWKSIG